MKTLKIMSDSDCPSSVKEVPWEYAVKFEDQAKRNHGQDLETLNRRGGLSQREFYGAAHGLTWSQIRDGVTAKEASDWLETKPWIIKEK